MGQSINPWIPFGVSTVVLLAGMFVSVAKLSSGITTYFEKRLKEYVIKADHDKECAANQMEISEKLGRLEAAAGRTEKKIDDNEKRSADTRHGMRNDIAKMGIDLARMDERTKNVSQQVQGLSQKLDQIPVKVTT